MQLDARRRPGRRLFASVFAVALLTGFAVATAVSSVGIATGATHASLEVDAGGDVLVRWSQGGVEETALVTGAGRLVRGGLLSGPDVSKPAHLSGLPSIVALRSAAHTLWALQLLAIGPGNRLSLDLSRWQGAPTQLSLASDGTRLTGSVSFAGKPVSGLSMTLAGLRPRVYVYLECFGCGGQAGWVPMLGVPPRADGTFAALIRPAWKGSRYRASVIGPNAGTTYAPDAQTVIAAG